MLNYALIFLLVAGILTIAVIAGAGSWIWKIFSSSLFWCCYWFADTR
jgi:uncharacterized membrane protein YtjA (UPF0391 family)